MHAMRNDTEGPPERDDDLRLVVTAFLAMAAPPQRRVSTGSS